MSVLISDEQPETVLGVRLDNAKRDSVEMMQSLQRMQSEAKVTGRDGLAYDIATLWEKQQEITAQLTQIVGDERRTAVTV